MATVIIFQEKVVKKREICKECGAVIEYSPCEIQYRVNKDLLGIVFFIPCVHCECEIKIHEHSK